MKKLFLFLIAGSIGLCSGIAVNWQIDVGSEHKGQTYYMFTGDNFDAVNTALGQTYKTKEALATALTALVAYDYYGNAVTGILAARGNKASAELELNDNPNGHHIFGLVITAAPDAIADQTPWLMSQLTDCDASGMAYDNTIQPKPTAPGTLQIKANQTPNPWIYSGNVNIASVPEPSSALLLFLGLASLGLKRKQA